MDDEFQSFCTTPPTLPNRRVIYPSSPDAVRLARNAKHAGLLDKEEQSAAQSA